MDNPNYKLKSARHRKLIRRWSFSRHFRPYRESESWEKRKERWAAELMEGFEW